MFPSCGHMPYILHIDNSLNFEDDVNCGKKNFKWWYDGCIGTCNLSNCKETRKKIWDFNGIRTHGLCVCTAVLYHLSYEDPYIGSRPIYWDHVNPWKEWNMKVIWTAEIQILNEDMIVAMVIAI